MKFHSAFPSINNIRFFFCEKKVLVIYFFPFNIT